MSGQLECRDCHASFEFAAGEQRFFDARGLRELPQRCPACRDARKRRFRARFEDRSAFDPRRLGWTARREAPAEASLCASCGLPADLVFRPAIGRPVYCQECYNLRQKDGAAWRG